METSQSVCVIRIKGLFTRLYFALSLFFYKRTAQTVFTHGHTLRTGRLFISMRNEILL